MIEFRIDRRKGVAAYLQIVQQAEQALRMGTLQVGDKLPTAREVVEATAINPNTVLKAYRELERAGLVEARRGLGTFVSKSLARPESSAENALRAQLADWTARARDSGLQREDILALVITLLDKHDAAPAPAGPGSQDPSQGPSQDPSQNPARPHSAHPRSAHPHSVQGDV